MSNYYLALGIEQNADISKIKKAYRFYCKKYHPDLASEDEKRNFLKIQKAYETLSDAEKRRIYDRQLNNKSIPVNIINDSFWTKKQKTERRIRKYSSLLDDFFNSFVSGFFEEDFSGKKDLFIELILSHDEAERGGNFPVKIPVIEECSICRGIGVLNSFICNTCRGSGKSRSHKEIFLHVPAGVSDGMETAVSLEGIGLRNVFLHIDIIISNY